jgi:hypothetical protein
MAVARSFRDGWLTSLKIDALGNDSAELFLFRLGLKADKNGVYHGEPELLRAAAYPLQVSRRRLADVTRYRDQCVKAGLLRLWTAADGRPYVQILNYRQRTPNERPQHPLPPGEPDDTGQEHLPLADPPPHDPPRRPRKKVNRREVSAGAREAGGTHDTRLAELCLDELARRWPKHDVAACLRDAKRHVRKERGDEATVSVWWFEKFWLPGAAERKEAPPPVAAPAPISTAEAEAAMERTRQQFLAMPEPPRGTLEHSLWTEARRAS